MRYLRALILTPLLLLSFSISVEAQTSPQMQAQLDSLLAQLAQLQTQLLQTINAQTTSTPASSQTTAPSASGTRVVYASCPLLGRTLRPGMSGGDVANLQAFLAEDVTLYPERTLSAYFGPRTQAAVQKFQTRHSVVTSGTPETTGFGGVGPGTRAAIVAVCTAAAGQAPTPVTPLYAPPTIQPVVTLKNCTSGTLTIGSGASAQMYSVSSAPLGSSCAAYAQSRSCTNGILNGGSEYQFATCLEPSAQSCLVQAFSVANGSSRTFYSRPKVKVGESCNSYAEGRACTNGVMSGGSNYTYPSCSVESFDSCTASGVTIAHGSSRTFYTQDLATSTASCSSYAQTRTCTNGVLSGDATYAKNSCSSGSCVLDNRLLASGSSSTFYFAQNIPSNELCSSYAQTRTCSSGALSGTATYKYATCTPAPSTSCVMDSAIVANGASSVFYTATVAPAGATCSSISTSRTCANGALGGSATHNRATCTDTQACTLNGVTVSHGSAATFYSASTVAFGTTCSSAAQVRTCTNGALSGGATYQYSSCSVNPPTAMSDSRQLAAALSALQSALTSLLEWLNR